MRIGIKRTYHLFAVDWMGDNIPPTSAEPTAIRRFALDKERGFMYAAEDGPWILYDDAHPPTSARFRPLDDVVADMEAADPEFKIAMEAERKRRGIPPTSAEAEPADVEAIAQALEFEYRSGEANTKLKAAAMLRALSKDLADLRHDMAGYIDANTQYINEIESLSERLDAEGQKFDARTAVWQERIASLSKERDQWHARALALFWSGYADDVTGDKIREATALIDAALAAKEPT